MNIKDAIKEKEDEIAGAYKILAILQNPKLEPLSTSVSYNAVGGSALWVFVNNREDLQVFLALVQSPWKKRVSDKQIIYSNTTENEIRIVVYASNNALPPTCRVIKEEVQVPAREAYTETVEKIICDV